MKIDPITPQSPTGARRVRSSGQSSGTSFRASVEETPEESSSLSAVAPTGSIEALLTLQEVGQSSDKEEKARRRGEELLIHLESIRYGLLDGALSQAELRRLSNLLSAQRPPTMDPRLQSVLDEIEVRAAVELAKFERL